MILSESDSKYVRGYSERRTFVIENSFESSSENSNESSSGITFKNSDENISKKPSAKRRRTSLEENVLDKCCNYSLQ